MGDAAESKKAVTVVTFDETTVDDASHKRLHFNWLTLWLCLWQLAMIILFTFCTRFPNAPVGDMGAQYAMFMDTHTMMAVGFGFLYTLLRRYAWSGVAYNYLICALILQWGILCQGFWENVRVRVQHPSLPGKWFPSIPVSLSNFIGGDYTVATVLISFGAVLGRISPTQLVLMAFWEVIVSTGNVSIANHLNPGINYDPGGSMVIHVFGASFGLAFAAAFGDAALRGVGNGESVLGTTRNNGTFAMIGTLFLFLFWPSFNAATLSGSAAERAVCNTLLSICASVVVVFAASKAVHGGSCFDMEHVQNATLAGGVAIGAACQYITNLGGAVGLGATAGLVSVAGFTHLGPRLKRAGLTDTCGIASLHWMPGLIGGFASAVAAVGADPVSNRTGYTQGGYQAAVTFISLGLGLSSGALRAPCCRAPPYACAATDGAPLRAPGALAGRVLRSPRFAEPMADNFYEDGGGWNVPHDGEELPELETDVAEALRTERQRLLDAVLAAVGESLGRELPPASALTPRADDGVAVLGERSRRGAADARSANKRFTEGSVHGGRAGGAGPRGVDLEASIVKNRALMSTSDVSV